MSNQQPKQNTRNVQQEILQGLKRGQQRNNQIRKLIKQDTKKIKQIQQLKQQQANRIFKKSVSNQYIQEQSQDLEVPVDGDLQRGSKVFMAHCSSCHGLESSSVGNNYGPSLGLIYNKKFGSDSQYRAYSEGMINSHRFWSAKNLFNFMLNPKIFMKGTSCPISKQGGLQSEEDRADLIQFLRQFTSELSKNIKIKEVKSQGYEQYQSKLYVDEIAPDSITQRQKRREQSGGGE